MADHFKIGLIQTSLDKNVAWTDDPVMKASEADRSLHEIEQGFRAFDRGGHHLDAVIMPELSVARDYIEDLKRLAAASNAIIIAGLDYGVDKTKMTVRNQAILLVPERWRQSRPSRRVGTFYFGKEHPAPNEKMHLEAQGFRFLEDPVIWLLDTGECGRVGLCICYDFMDIDRPAIYKGYIQHLLVLAYNQDVNAFSSLAAAFCRTVYCNVVICNTGFYGGSVAVSPFYHPWDRIIYNHEGKRLFSTQVFSLPVSQLRTAQGHDGSALGPGGFKHPPPGFIRKP